MVASSSSKWRSLISSFFICVSTSSATNDLILRSSRAAKCLALTAADARAAAAAVCILFSLKAPSLAAAPEPAPVPEPSLPSLPSLVSPSPLLSSVLMSTSAAPPAEAAGSVGEDLFVDLSDLVADLSPEGEEADDSFGFLSVLLVLPDADDDDVELESVFVLVLSDFVLSLDLASSVVVCYLVLVMVLMFLVGFFLVVEFVLEHKNETKYKNTVPNGDILRILSTNNKRNNTK